MVRDSNVELMRLVCMMMILVHHILCHGLFSVDCLLGSDGEIDLFVGSAVVVNSLYYIGVNCFILITGYYGIRFKFKGLLKLYVILVFYGFISCIIGYFMGTYEFTLGSIKYVFLPFSNFARTNWWFMNCYVIFFMISPLIRLDVFDKKQYQKVLFLVCLANVYMGYWWKDYNPSGYCVAQFVFIYVIGGYIRRYVTISDSMRWKAFTAYILCCLLHATLVVIDHYVSIPHWYPASYNNPLLVIAAIGFFCFTTTFHFNSKIVNTLALSAISIYLLQNMELLKMCCDIIRGTSIFSKNIFLLVFGLLLFSLVFSFVAILIDQIRLLVSNSITSLFDKLLKNYVIV